MLKLLLIRHGKTYGNTLGRYIGGATDEPLCPEGIRLLQEKQYPEVSRIYVSPMIRCRQTAGLLYPDREQKEIPLFRECDFGIFENKNYQELSGEPAYQAWIDSSGTLPFPEGESMEDFRDRCCRGFENCVEDAFGHSCSRAAAVVHGGTIMSIMSRYALPPQDYFCWQIKNGEYYELCLTKEQWEEKRQICSWKKG